MVAYGIMYTLDDMYGSFLDMNLKREEQNSVQV